MKTHQNRGKTAKRVEDRSAGPGTRAEAVDPPKYGIDFADRSAASTASAGMNVQTKLTVGAPDDPLEREADRMADRIVSSMAVGSGLLQAKAKAPCSCGGSCLKCCEEKRLLRRASGADGANLPSVPDDFLSGLGPGSALAPRQRALFEPALGVDFSPVRIHSGPTANAKARSIQARAFTAGRDIVFGAGELRPGSPDGQRLLAHELTHVVQQGAARRLSRNALPVGARPSRLQRSVECGAASEDCGARVQGETMCLDLNSEGASSLEEYTDYLRCAELKTQFPERKFLSMLRQLYYGESWSVSPNISEVLGMDIHLWDSIIPCSHSIGDPTPRLGKDLFNALKKSQQIDGIDIGHLFAGLEAMTCPERTSMHIVNVPNEESATFTGDLGSAVAHYAAKLEQETEHRTWPEALRLLEAYYSRFVSQADVEGNIDAFALRTQELGISCGGSFGEKLTLTRPVSEFVQEYYSKRSPKSAHRNRYRCVLSGLGANFLNGRLKNRAHVVSVLARRVYAFALPFLLYKLLPVKESLLTGAGARLRMRLAATKVSEWFVDHLDKKRQENSF